MGLWEEIGGEAWWERLGHDETSDWLNLGTEFPPIVTSCRENERRGRRHIREIFHADWSSERARQPKASEIEGLYVKKELAFQSMNR